MNPMGRAIAEYFKTNKTAIEREQSFQMQYKDTIGEPFDWLYTDLEKSSRSKWLHG